MPCRPRRFSPTTLTMACRGSQLTCAKRSRSAEQFRRAESDSTASEMLTCELETMSTWHSVAVEHRQHFPQESAWDLGAFTGDVHDGAVALGGDGPHGKAVARHMRPYAGARARRIARVQHENRDVLLDGRQQRGRVQHLGAERGQFRGFLEADLLESAAPPGRDWGRWSSCRARRSRSRCAPLPWPRPR